MSLSKVLLKPVPLSNLHLQEAQPVVLSQNSGI